MRRAGAIILSEYQGEVESSALVERVYATHRSAPPRRVRPLNINFPRRGPPFVLTIAPVCLTRLWNLRIGGEIMLLLDHRVTLPLVSLASRIGTGLHEQETTSSV